MFNAAVKTVRGALTSRPLLGYLGRRLAVLIVTLLGVTLLTFAGTRLLPGEVGEGMTQERTRAGSATEREERRQLYALDQPLVVQYGHWLKRSVCLDFDRSWITHRPVGAMLREAAPRSLQVMIPAVLLWYLLGVPLGVFLAVKHRTLQARLVTVGLFALYSLPGFFVGTLLIVLLANPEHLAWFPAGGLSGDRAPVFQSAVWLVTTQEGWSFLVDRSWHLVLPVACMVYATVAYLAEQTRVSMLDSLAQPWIRTARAKGLPERLVVGKHALRHALIPVITLSALALPAAFTGSVFLEKIFSIEGIGWTLVQAVEERDHPVVMAIATLAAALTLIGLTLADLLYVAVDPRIEFR